MFLGRSGVRALIRLGDGTGFLASGLPVATGTFGVTAAAAGDLNGDGDLDLVLFSASALGNLGSIVFGRGDGLFEAPLPLL